MEWNKNVFGKVERDIKLKQAKLQQIQNSINSIQDVMKDRTLRNELEDPLNREELMRAQKARTRWILQGDRNTKYFQTVVRQRRAKSRILQIKDNQGNIIENLGEIKIISANHFKT